MLGRTLSALVLAFVVLGTPALATAQQFHVSDMGMTSLTKGPFDSRLYYRKADASCPGGEIAAPCILRRVTTSVSGTAIASDVYQNPSLISDTDSLHSNADFNSTWSFYLGKNHVIRRSTYSGSPVTTLTTRSGSGEIAVDESFAYWIENTSSGGSVFRIPVTGGTKEPMYSSASQLEQLEVDGLGGVLFVNQFFDALIRVVPSGPGFSTQIGPGLVQTYAFDTTHVYALTGISTGIPRLYRADLTDLATFSHGTFIGLTGENAFFPSAAVDDTHLYYVKNPGGSSGNIFRLNKSSWVSGTPVAITAVRSGMGNLNIANDHLFWQEGNTIYRLALSSAIPIQADAGVASIEVTQGMQLTDNSIDLVEGKPTTVRAYPTLSALSGMTQATITVQLFGFDSLNAPLTPLLFAQSISMTSGTAARSDPNASANFRLPPSWVTGVTRLEARASVFGIYDPNPSNDLSPSVTPTYRRKTHPCIKFLPIRTSSGPTYWMRNTATGNWTPGFIDTIRRFESLWPIPHMRFYTQNTPIRKPQFLGTPQPFNMTDSADSGHLLAALWEHNVFDGAPDWCGGQNARTHYVAMVHPSIDTTTSVGTRLGTGTFGEPFSWVKMTTGGTTFDGPQAGGTIAHELTHNYNNLFGNDEDYQHVNCGLPAGSDFNNIYPYPPCSMGPMTAGWGFDRITNTVINPTATADYMTYMSPKWSSDYRWNLYINKLNDRPASSLVLGGEPLAATATISDAISLVGIIDPTETGGEVLSAIYAPPGFSIPETNSDSHGIHAPSGSFELVLQDGGGNVLTSHPIFPTRAEEEDPGTGNFYFFATVAYEPGTATFEIVRNGSATLVSQQVTASPPVVSINTPTSGSTWAGSLNIQWTASDPDGGSLKYTVQYRENATASWQSLDSGLTTPALNIADTSDLPGGTGAFVRVIASDGFNIATAEAGPFTLANHAPRPAIMEPPEGRQYLINHPVQLLGRAFDPEEGDVADKDHSWTLTGPTNLATTGNDLILSDLPPGNYSLTLSALDGTGASGSTTGSFTVATKWVPDGLAPTLDGKCHDSGYASDKEPILVRSGTTPAVARFVHSGNFLYVCVDNLPSLSALGQNKLHLRFDSNDSGEPTPQSGDYWIELRDDGVVLPRVGIPGIFVIDTTPQTVVGLSTPQTSSTWMAELRIDTSELGGWNHLAAVQVMYDSASAIDPAWPLNSTVSSPASWGTVAFGRLNQSVSFPQPSTQNVTDVLAPQVSASSGLPIQLTSNTPDVCQIVEGNLVNMVGPGTCTLVATQLGNFSYNAANAVQHSFQVNPPVSVPIGAPFLLLGGGLLGVGWRVSRKRRTAARAWS